MRLLVRNILGAAWPLFKASLPVCLPLAVVGVAASATPGAESLASGEGYGFVHSRDWWGVCVASILLTLVCYGAVLHQQLRRAADGRAPVLDSLRLATRRLPASLLLMLPMVLPLLLAMLVAAWHASSLLAWVLRLVALWLLVQAWFAWPALLGGELSPGAALAASIGTMRRHWREFAALLATLAAAILVFALLTGVLVGLATGLAGQAVPVGGLALSRWLMALALALPVVYGSAVTVTAWRLLKAVPASPALPASGT
ncbi:MAG TPA: hypothetical protein VMH77_03760 [Steroidobacteraceae bacterium]|nr:hypothetical protein [Steroidobacteraceae bacterium]